MARNFNALPNVGNICMSRKDLPEKPGANGRHPGKIPGGPRGDAFSTAAGPAKGDHGSAHESKPNGAAAGDIARIAETEEDITALREHLKQVIEGTAFKGSHRSGQFLSYIVEQSIAGNFVSLKERMIGVELFGRSVAYDTGDDAIVRVTASDVRKRLLQHYGKYGTPSKLRIWLPLGSYIPEITRDPHEVNPSRTPATEPVPAPEVPVSFAASHPAESNIDRRYHIRWIYFATFLALLNLAALALFWNRSPRGKTAADSVLPWSILFRSPHSTQLITSDVDMIDVEALTGQPISVSDYANHNYIPSPNKLSAEEQRFARLILRGGEASWVDTPIAVNIAELAPAGLKQITVRGARSIELADLQTDSNLILLGSPSSNPWSALFNDQLDFRFVFDRASGQEIIRNFHPRQGELASYVPTALGWATGQSFATISFIQNPDQSSQVLLLAGANAEGTEAAGKLITDLPRLSASLRQCGISPSGPPRYFQILLHLNTMAGSPTSVDVLACHTLAGSSSR